MKGIFPRFGSSRKLKSLHEGNRKIIGGIVPRIILIFFIVAALSIIYISLTLKRAGLIVYSLPDLKVGDISPEREIALFDFQVPKSEKQLQEERLRAAENVLPVFVIDSIPSKRTYSEIDTLFSMMNSLPQKSVPDSVKRSIEDALSGRVSYSEIVSLGRSVKLSKEDSIDELKNIIKESFTQLYHHLIVSQKKDLSYLSQGLLLVDDGVNQRSVKVEEVIDIDNASALFKQMILEHNKASQYKNSLKTIQNVAVHLIRPNLYYDELRTRTLREHAMNAIPLYSVSYKKNERIIEANVPVSASQLAALEAYRKEMESRSFKGNRLKHYGVAGGKIIVGLGIISIIVGYIYLYRYKIFTSFSRLLLLTIISALPLSVAYYIAWTGSVSEYLIPVAIASILVTILFDAELGIFISLGISLIVATLVAGSGVRMGILYFLAGGVGVLTVGRVRHRKEFYRSMFFVPLAMAISVVSTNDWLTDSSAAQVGKEMFIAAINGFFCPIIAIGLLPLLESVFRIVTDITLLELSDLNNPLLKEEAVNAPGTFSASLMVGALAEAASEKIGANPLLARVGAYYHDIGKIVIPEYFIENQIGGDNPHDRLSPHMSALVIASHVKEGYELGLKYGLPDAILDIIKQHHGTSLMASIHHKAAQSAKGTKVDESEFRYPGPKPQTREAGIVMLADLVEAASRTVHERSPNKYKTLINTIIHRRFMEGELDECDLTLKDLHNIEESFLPVLVGSYHGRIEYPWQKKEKETIANSVHNTSSE